MKKLLYALAVYLAAIASTGCSTYLSKCEDKGKAQGWNQDQIDDACAAGDKVFFSKPTNADNTTFTVLYSRLTVGEVRRQLDDALKNYDEILNPNNKGIAKYLEFGNLRGSLEHNEKVVKLIRSRLRTAELDVKFKEAMGQISNYDASDGYQGYNAKRIFVRDPNQLFLFNSDQIEEARARGILQPIEHLKLEVERKYAVKRPDPATPDDPNEFIWKPSSLGLDLVNYKILDEKRPQDNLGNYIEGYRVFFEDGPKGEKRERKESKPALKIFFPRPGMAIVVLDSDKEGKDTGFGLPDFVDQVGGIVSVSDVARSEAILNGLFAEKPEEKRIMPQVKKIQVEIAKVGTPVDVWEKAPTSRGWVVPFKYWNEKKDNFNIKIKFKKVDRDAPNPHSEFREIEYIAKEWTGGDRYTPSTGAVVEYFRPKSKLSDKLHAEVVHNESTRKLHVTLENGEDFTAVVTPGSNNFIEDKPYATAYNEGQKRWWIEKDDGKDVFNKRREMAKPKEDKTGRYDVNEDDALNMSAMQK